MRTAEEILNQFWQCDYYLEAPLIHDQDCRKCKHEDSIIEAINTARKEAVEECAKRAKLESWRNKCDILRTYKVDQQSILSLIDELK